MTVLRWLLYPLLLVLGGGLGYVVLTLPQEATGLRDLAAGHLDASGVANPVTAVLLNFRGYDTLLEMAVLFVALLGLWSLGDSRPPRDPAPGPVLDTLTRLLAPVLLLVAAYLLWVGAHAPGGAFQAGSILGAAGVLMLLAGFSPPQALLGWPLRLTVAAGLLAFLAGGLLTLVAGARLLEYPAALAGGLIFFIEAAATAAIGVTLAALFLGGARPTGKDR